MAARLAQEHQAEHKKTRARSPHTHYTQEQKVQAVTIVVSMGGVTPASIAEVNKLLNINIKPITLKHWQQELKPTILQAEPKLSPNDNLDVSRLVAETRRKLMVSHATTLAKVAELQGSDDVLKTASWNQLVLGGAILTDKMLLLAGRTPELDNELTGLQQDCIGTDCDPLTILQDIRKVVQLRKQVLFSKQDVIEGEIKG
jgi:alpha-L-fucosidase